MAIFIVPVRNALFPISTRPEVCVPPMIMLKFGLEELMAGAVTEAKATSVVPVIVDVPALIVLLPVDIVVHVTAPHDRVFEPLEKEPVLVIAVHPIVDVDNPPFRLDKADTLSVPVIVAFVDVNVPEFAIETVDNPPFRLDKPLTLIVPVIVVFVEVSVPVFDILIHVNNPPVIDPVPDVNVLLFVVTVVHDNAPPVIDPVPDVNVLLFVLIEFVVRGRLIVTV